MFKSLVNVFIGGSIGVILIYGITLYIEYDSNNRRACISAGGQYVAGLLADVCYAKRLVLEVW